MFEFIMAENLAAPIQLSANAEFIRRKLVDAYNAFFAGSDNWNPSSRFQMKGMLWIYLHFAAEEVARDGMDTDPGSLEITRSIIKACRELETECLSDLDKLEEAFELVEDFNAVFSDMQKIA